MESANNADIRSFERDGYLVVANLFSKAEVEDMKMACQVLVEKLDPDTERPPVFKTTGEQKDRGDYFLTSGDKIRYFYETGAVDEDGRLLSGADKFKSINKIGHALHVLEPTFNRYTFDDRIKTLVRRIGISKPAVCQSMYIFKQARIGGPVPPHLDATYLYTHPLGKVIGIWVALEDAKIDNGCLWFIPGSHKEVQKAGDVPVRFIRVKEEDIEREGCTTKSTGPHPKYDDAAFVPVPIKAGDAIVIHGLVVHKSEANRSETESRHIYTYHIVEQEGTTWDQENWLQPTTQMPFTPLSTQ